MVKKIEIVEVPDEPETPAEPEPMETPAEPEPVETPAEPEPVETPGAPAFTGVTDFSLPDPVVRYNIDPVVTVTASWLSDAEAKVLRAQHRPVVDAANTVPETKAVDPVFLFANTVKPEPDKE